LEQIKRHYSNLLKADGEADEFSKQWGWYSLIEVLCDKDLTRAENVYDMPCIEFLNWWGYKVAIAEKEARNVG